MKTGVFVGMACRRRSWTAEDTAEHHPAAPGMAARQPWTRSFPAGPKNSVGCKSSFPFPHITYQWRRCITEIANDISNSNLVAIHTWERVFCNWLILRMVPLLSYRPHPSFHCWLNFYTSTPPHFRCSTGFWSGSSRIHRIHWNHYQYLL